MRAVEFALALLGAAVISAQGQPTPAFEVASLKVAPPRSGTAGLFTVGTDPGMVRY